MNSENFKKEASSVKVEFDPEVNHTFDSKFFDLNKFDFKMANIIEGKLRLRAALLEKGWFKK